jgi:hypothetical protein
LPAAKAAETTRRRKRRGGSRRMITNFRKKTMTTRLCLVRPPPPSSNGRPFVGVQLTLPTDPGYTVRVLDPWGNTYQFVASNGAYYTVGSFKQTLLQFFTEEEEYVPGTLTKDGILLPPMTQGDIDSIVKKWRENNLQDEERALLRMEAMCETQRQKVAVLKEDLACTMVGSMSLTATTTNQL